MAQNYTEVKLSNNYGTYSIQSNSIDLTISEVLEMFDNLLLAAGYRYNGELDIICEDLSPIREEDSEDDKEISVSGEES